MNKEELAAKLDGCEYRREFSNQTEKILDEAKKNGLVIVYGASDDLMEFSGAIHDEVGCFDGGHCFVDREGVVEAFPGFDSSEQEEAELWFKHKNSAKRIDAIWGEGSFTWSYKTDIPHATFDVFENDLDDEDQHEDEKKYCKGIVFSIEDLPSI